MVGQKGLGRGLDALLGGSQSGDSFNASEVQKLPIRSVKPNVNQPRTEFDEAGLEELAASIRSQGVLQPILVRPLQQGEYELVAGERRLRASKKVGLREIPALIREMSDQESLAIALIENLQREDLNAIEEAKGYKQLMEQFGLNQEELAKNVGKSRSAVANCLRLLNLPSAVQVDVQEGKLSAGHARALMAVSDNDAASDLHKRIVDSSMTVRAAEAMAGHWKETGSLPEAGEVVVAAPSKKAAAATPEPPKASDPALVELQGQLADLFGLPVQLAGQKDKGKLSFKFSSEDELRDLLDRLGVTLS